jgi:hypothetical protein
VDFVDQTGYWVVLTETQALSFIGQSLNWRQILSNSLMASQSDVNECNRLFTTFTIQLMRLRSDVQWDEWGTPTKSGHPVSMLLISMII